MRYIFCVLILISSSALAEPQQVFKTTCGPSKFQVSVINNGFPLDNTFTLSVIKSDEATQLFKGEDGGWFHAACMSKKDGTPLLVFQSYCGGSGCVEGKYGVIEPFSLKALLLPSPNNTQNSDSLSKLLGYPAPHLYQHKDAFCCGE